MIAVPRQLFAPAHSAYNRYTIHKRYANPSGISTTQLQHVITPPQMARSYSEKEEGIQKAIGTWHSNPGGPIADIAREFEVSLWALRRRLHRVPSKIEGGGHNKKLTPDGEQAIIQHIQLLEDFEITPRPKFLQSITNSILRTNHTNSSTPPPTMGINWPANFIKRHSELYKQK
jgi:transposase-like protein